MARAAYVEKAVATSMVRGWFGTDMTVPNQHLTVDVPTTISKFVALGMPLEAALAAATGAAAAKLGLGRTTGRIAPGLEADLALCELQEGRFDYADTYGHTVRGTQRLVPLETFRRGRRLEPLLRRTRRYGFVIQ